MSEVVLNNISPFVELKTVNPERPKNQVTKCTNTVISSVDSVNIGISKNSNSLLKTGYFSFIGALSPSASTTIPAAVINFKLYGHFGKSASLSILAFGAASTLTGTISGAISANVTDSKNESAILAAISSGLALGAITGLTTKSADGALAGLALGTISGVVAGCVAKK